MAASFDSLEDSDEDTVNEAHVDNPKFVEQECLEDLDFKEDYFSIDYSDGLQEASQAKFTDETSVSVTNSSNDQEEHSTQGNVTNEVNADETIDNMFTPAEVHEELIP